MKRVDSEIHIDVEITDFNRSYTTMEILIPYLNKYIEVKIPNNIRKGPKLRLHGLGHFSSNDEQGDLYLVVDSVEYPNGKPQRLQQKIFMVRDNNFDEVNVYLESGWNVKELEPTQEKGNVYIVLEKAIDQL